MPNCSNCSNSNSEYHLCSKCYHNIFKTLYCDGHCGTKCDPSQRTNSNTFASPWFWYCNACLKNLPSFRTNDEINKSKIRLKKLEEENQNYLKKNQKLENQIEAFSGQFHDFRNKLENFYDIIVDVDSLRYITKGWKVKFTEIGKKHYDIMKDKEVLIVGVVGNINSGKSFFLSKLSGEVLPDGESINTKGISIKYPKMDDKNEARYILMDSIGYGKALLKNDSFMNDPNMPKEEELKELKRIASD